LSQTLDLENFSTASRSRCQRNSSSSTVEFVDDTYTTIDKESWLSTTSRSTSCNPLTPILRFAVYSLYNLFLQLTRCGLTKRGCRPSCPHTSRKSTRHFLTSFVHRQTGRQTKTRQLCCPHYRSPELKMLTKAGTPCHRLAMVELSLTTHLW